MQWTALVSILILCPGVSELSIYGFNYSNIAAYDNKYGTSSHLLTMGMFSLCRCGAECAGYNGTCKAFFFNKAHGVCKLYSENIHILTMKDESGFKAYAFGGYWYLVKHILECGTRRVGCSEASTSMSVAVSQPVMSDSTTTLLAEMLTMDSSATSSPLSTNALSSSSLIGDSITIESSFTTGHSDNNDATDLSVMPPYPSATPVALSTDEVYASSVTADSITTEIAFTTGHYGNNDVTYSSVITPYTSATPAALSANELFTSSVTADFITGTTFTTGHSDNAVTDSSAIPPYTSAISDTTGSSALGVTTTRRPCVTVASEGDDSAGGDGDGEGDGEGDGDGDGDEGACGEEETD